MSDFDSFDKAMKNIIQWFIDKGVPDELVALNILTGISEPEYMELALALRDSLPTELREEALGVFMDKSIEILTSE